MVSEKEKELITGEGLQEEKKNPIAKKSNGMPKQRDFSASGNSIISEAPITVETKKNRLTNTVPSKKSNSHCITNNKDEEVDGEETKNEQQTDNLVSVMTPMAKQQTKPKEKKSLSSKEFKIIEPARDSDIREFSKKPEESKQKYEVFCLLIEQSEMKADADDGIKEIDDATISAAKKLKLMIIEGPVLPPGTTILLNAGGLIGSKRGMKDGCAYFGTELGSVTLSIKFYRAQLQSTITSFLLKNLASGKNIL